MANAPSPVAAAVRGGQWALLLAILALFAPCASAHAERVDSHPAEGEVLPQIPAQVWVRLSERIDPGSARLEVRDAAGVRWDDGNLTVEDRAQPVLAISMRPDTPEGGYRAWWSALSEVDGHANSGSFGFAVGPHDPLAGRDGDPEVPLASAFGRAVLYGGLALAYAAAAFLVVLRGTPYDPALARPWLPRGAALHAAGLLLFTGGTWAASGLAAGAFLRSDVGDHLLLRWGLALAALLALSAPVERRLHGKAHAAGTVLLLAAGAMSSRLGHLAAFGPSRMALDFVHLALAATWAGGLALLLHYLAARRPSPEDARAVGLRFGTLALTCVAGLAATGLASTLAVLGRDAFVPAAFGSSAYGRVLAAKVALTLAMLALASVNRFVHLAPRGRAQGPWAPLAWEAGTGFVVLALAGFLASLDP